MTVVDIMSLATGLTLIGLMTVALLCGVYEVIAHFVVKRMRISFIRAITVEQWLEFDIMNLTKNYYSPNVITTVWEEGGTSGEITSDTDYFYPHPYHFLHIKCKRIRCTGRGAFHIPIEKVPNLGDALRLISL